MSQNVTPSTGARSSVAIGEELTFGEPVAPTHDIPFTSESLTNDEDTLESEAIRGDRGKHYLFQGTNEVGGDISFELSATGFGMILKHALGDYVKLQYVDGGKRGRCEVESVLSSTGHDSDEKLILPLAKEQVGPFPESPAAEDYFSVVHRTGVNDDLTHDDNSGSGYTYDEFTPSELTYVDSVTADDDAYDGGGQTTTVASITLMAPIGYDGNPREPKVNTEGGLIELGSERQRVKYFEAASVTDSNGNPSYKLYLDTDDVPSGATDVNAGDYVYGFAGLTLAAPSTPGQWTDQPTIEKGNFVYHYNSTYTDVWTHHMERGRELPVGMTVEADRDGAIFLYTGSKVGSLNVSFDQDSIVTGSATLVGREELTSGELAADVQPGDTSIYVRDAEAFVNPNNKSNLSEAVLTIGERTDIRYTDIQDATTNGFQAGDGVWEITIKDSSQIEMFHSKPKNVDPRTTTATEAGLLEQNSKPLTSFESRVYVEGTYEEVLSGELTLENNVNSDKTVLGSRSIQASVAEEANVTASVTVEFDDGKHYRRFRNGARFPFEFRCISEHQDDVIGNTGVPVQAYFFMPKCKFDGDTPTVDDRSYIEHDMPIMAVVDDAYNTTDLVTVLVSGSEHDVEDNR